MQDALATFTKPISEHYVIRLHIEFAGATVNDNQALFGR
jgi:hypothetical protein